MNSCDEALMFMQEHKSTYNFFHPCVATEYIYIYYIYQVYDSIGFRCGRSAKRVTA